MAIRLDALYYELDLKTRNFDQQIVRAESNLKRLATTILKHPVAATGALAGAFVGAAVQAAMFADKMHQSMLRATNTIPGATGLLKGMQRELIALSKEVPFSIDALHEGLERVGRGGVRGPAEALHQLRLASLGAVATGEEDLLPMIELLDSAMDAFDISAQGAGKAVDLFVAATKRGVPIEDLAQVIDRAGANAHQLGAGLDQVVAATIQMREAGAPVRQIIASFGAGLGEMRREGDLADGTMGRLATSVTFVNGQLKLAGAGAEGYADTLTALNTQQGITIEQARQMGLTAEALAQVVQNRLSAEWLDFGNTVLPFVIKGFQALDVVMEELTGTAEDRRLTAAARQVLQLRGPLARLTELGKAGAADLRRFDDNWKKMVSSLAQGHNVLAMSKEDLAGLIEELERASPERLQTALRGLLGITLPEGVIEARRRDIIDRLRAAQAHAKAFTLPSAGPPARAPEAAPVPEDLLRRREAFLAQLRANLAGLTATLVDDMTLALEQIEAKARELFRDRLPAEVTAGLEQLRAQIETQRFLEPFAQEIDGIEARVGQIGDAFGEIPATIGLELLPDLERIEDALRGQLALVEAQGGDTSKLKTELDRIEAIWKRIGKAVGQATDGVADARAEHEKLLTKLRDQATSIERAARGALQLAEAFGLVDENTARTLENIAQIAASLPGILAKGGPDPTAILSVVGALSGIISSLFGGESPEEQRRKEILRANTEAIAALTRVMGEFGLDITGRQFSGVQQAIQAALGNLYGRNLFQFDISKELAQVGLTLDDLRKVADALGIAFVGVLPNIDNLRQLLEAIAQTELTRFANTFTGQLEALGHFFELFDITDPIQQLQNLAQAIFSFADAPVLRPVTQFDLGTPEGRAALDQFIRETFERLRTGTITPEELGGLTPQQLLDVLRQLEGLLDQAAGTAAETGETRQFQVTRQITEVTGMRLASILTSISVFDQQTAENTALIAKLLSRPGGGLIPPAPPSGGFMPFAGPLVPVIGGDLHLHITAAPGTTLADHQLLADTIVRTLDEQLGKRARSAALLQGNVQR